MFLIILFLNSVILFLKETMHLKKNSLEVNEVTPRVCCKSLGINHRWKKRNEIDKMLLLRPGDE